MNVLFLTKKFPFPTKDGESIAVDSLTRSLAAKDCTIDLLSMNTSKHFVEVPSIREEIRQYRNVWTSFVDNQLKVADAVTNLFSGESYHISRFDYQDYHRQLEEILAEHNYDVIFLESIYLAPYIETIRSFSDAKLVMRAHNIEYEIWQRVGEQTGNPLKRTYLSMLTSRLKKYELSRMPLLDAIVFLTERDRRTVGQELNLKNTMVTPIGIDVKKHDYDMESYDRPTVGFIGSLDWQPNTEGLDWFLKKVWPLVREAEPQARCQIAGRNPSSDLLDLNIKGVEVLGEVPDAAAFVRDHAISIVPLLSGGGMRVKILEAMALGRCIVSTTIGAEGIDSSTMLIADDAQVFAERLIKMLHNPQTAADLGNRSRKLAMEHYDTERIGQRVHDFLTQLVTD